MHYWPIYLAIMRLFLIFTDLPVGILIPPFFHANFTKCAFALFYELIIK